MQMEGGDGSNRLEKWKSNLFFTQLLSILNESVVQFTMAGLLFFYRPSEITNGPATEVSSTITGYLCPIFSMLIMPGLSCWIILQKTETLEKHSKVYGAVYEHLKIHKLLGVGFTLIHVWRRIIICFLAIFMSDIPSIQIMIIFLMNNFVMVYVGNFRPFLSKEINRSELTNEFFIGNLSIIVLSFTEFCPDPNQQYKMGWAFIYIFSLGIALNFIQIIQTLL